MKKSAMGSIGRIIDAVSSQGFVLSDLLQTANGELVISCTGGSPLNQLLGSFPHLALLFGSVPLPILNTSHATSTHTHPSPPCPPPLSEDINSGLGADSIVPAGADALQGPKPPALEIESSSLLLVRPSAIKAGVLGRIVDQVLGSGFRVVNLKMVQLTRPNAQVPSCATSRHAQSRAPERYHHTRFTQRLTKHHTIKHHHTPRTHTGQTQPKPKPPLTRTIP